MLTNRQTKSQTDTIENNTTVSAWVAINGSNVQHCPPCKNEQPTTVIETTGLQYC